MSQYMNQQTVFFISIPISPFLLHTLHILPKFLFQNKKGLKINTDERRVYESLDAIGAHFRFLMTIGTIRP